LKYLGNLWKSLLIHAPYQGRDFEEEDASTVLKDPVCGKRTSRGKAHITIEYEDVAYFLCCPLCQTEFERAPAAYAKPELGEKVRKRARKGNRRQRR